MESAQQSFKVQAQVRHNAEVVKETFNDLFDWEKEIKEVEKKMQSREADKDEKIYSHPQVRSTILQLPQTAASRTSNGLDTYNSFLSPSGENQDTVFRPEDLKHKEANDIKDYGNKYVKSLQYSKAIDAYSMAIQLYNSDAIYYSNRALCYLKLERYDECIKDCDHAIDIDRLAVKAYYRRMLANEALGNNMDALKDCSTVLVIEPKNSEAKRSMERINKRLRENVQTAQGANFSPLRPNLVDILPIDKPAYKRSSKPLCRLAIADVISSKEIKSQENLNISDEDIDKLFNSNCGHFEEIKEPVVDESHVNINTTVPNKEKANEEKQEKSNVSLETEPEHFSASYKSKDSLNIEMQPINKKELSQPPTPTSSAQFYCNWKELTPEQKYLYLKNIPLNQLCKILGAGFDSDTLTDIINTLHGFYLPKNDYTQASSTLLEISKNKQLSILSLLMSKDERKVLVNMLNSLKEVNCLDEITTEEIKKNFSLN